jgi:serine/threonine-protein kinase
MKAAGGGLFDNVARELGELFAAEHSAEQHQIERDAALARRFRRRLKAKTSIEAQTTKLRVRPASQEGLAEGDPLDKKKPPDDDMVLVKGGRFLFGTPDDAPSYVDVQPFLVDRFPVTHLDWQRFVEGGGGKRPRSWAEGFPHHLAKCPVSGVEYQWVLEYAKWAGKRLPSEVEWELMARGFDGRLWPWGDVFDHAKMSGAWTQPIGQRGTEPIGRRTPAGDSPFGVCDIGQAWEWTSTPHVDGGFVVRGGAWRNRREPPMVTNRSREDVAAHDVTFRLVKSVADLDDKTEV